MRASLLVLLVAALFICGSVAAQSADSSTGSEVDCIPADDAPSNDILVYLGSSTGMFDCVGYNNNCASLNQDQSVGSSTQLPVKPICATKVQSYFYGGNTWSGLNVTQLIIVCVLVSIAGLAAVVAIARQCIRVRKTAAVADDKTEHVIEVNANKV